MSPYVSDVDLVRGVAYLSSELDTDRGYLFSTPWTFLDILYVREETILYWNSRMIKSSFDERMLIPNRYLLHATYRNTPFYLPLQRE